MQAVPYPFRRPRRAMTLTTSALAHIRHATRAATRRLGRRGAALGWFGTIAAVVAWSLADPVREPVLRAAPNYRIILSVAPPALWATVWAAVAVVCLIQAWMADDRLAFTSLIALLWIWSVMTLLALTQPIPQAATTGILLGGVVWSTFGGFVLVIAGWPEVPRAGEG
jgi:hypothetical protein